MKQIDHDIAVIGAGPAGSIAAYCLAQSGHDVMLIDSAVFPREKVCGDLIVPSVFTLFKKLRIPSNPITEKGYPIHTVHICGPFGTKLPIQFDFGGKESEIMVIPRIEVDRYVYDHAVSAGARHCTGRVTDIQRTSRALTIKVREGQHYKKFTSRIVIGADGVSSIVARRIGKKPWSHRAIAVRGYIEGISLNPHTIEAHFTSDIWPGYAWIFPTGANSANIGLGFDVRYYTESARSFTYALRSFLQRLSVKSRLSKDYCVHDIQTFPINVGPPAWDRIAGDRYLLTGDAAGLANALTGGGIANAMYSGMTAAMVASSNVTGDTVRKKHLSDYIKIVRRVLNRELWVSHVISRAVSLSPYIIRYILQNASKARWPYRIIGTMYSDVKIHHVHGTQAIGTRITIRKS